MPAYPSDRPNKRYDLIGVGLGPFNLGLAALLDRVPEIDALFLEQKPRFEWHSGMLLEGTTIQVPFLADLVTMADPTSRFSFLSYLQAQQRLYRFYFLERFHIPRSEYNAYCQWVADQLESCRFGQRVESVQWIEADDQSYFEISATEIDAAVTHRYRARHLVLGVGAEPYLPEFCRGLPHEDVFHSAAFRHHQDRCRRAAAIAIVGSGQSAAEIFLTLLQEQPAWGYRLDWFTRSRGFFPMEYSKLGLEHFSPDYVRYFYHLPLERRDAVRSQQDLLYKGISHKTIADIYDLLYERSVAGKEPAVRLLAHTEVEAIEPISVADATPRYRLCLRQWEQGQRFTAESDCVVLATGYRYTVPSFLEGIGHLIEWDYRQRYVVDLDYRLALRQKIPNQIFVQNGEIHTHGIGAPDLGLGPYRNAVIINTLTGCCIYPVQDRNVFQHFDVPPSPGEHALALPRGGRASG